jgi:hypothetical protein
MNFRGYLCIINFFLQKKTIKCTQLSGKISGYPRRYIRRISDILYSNLISEHNIRICIRYLKKKIEYPKILSEHTGSASSNPLNHITFPSDQWVLPAEEQPKWKLALRAAVSLHIPANGSPIRAYRGRGVVHSTAPPHSHRRRTSGGWWIRTWRVKGKLRQAGVGGRRRPAGGAARLRRPAAMSGSGRRFVECVGDWEWGTESSGVVALRDDHLETGTGV